MLVHEFGHFIFARKSGMKVEEFGFGFPPRIWAKKKGDTLYSLNLIPFGGFVKIYGEDGEHRDSPGSFSSKSVLNRLKVVVAGVVMNFLLAVFLLIISNFMGLRVDISDQVLANQAHDKKIQIIRIISGSPAEKAGLTLLDEIVGFQDAAGNTTNATDVDTVQSFVLSHLGQNIKILIRRGSKIVPISIQPRVNPPPGEGAMGIEMDLTGVVYYPWYESIWRGAYNAYGMLVGTLYGYGLLFKTLFTTGKLLADISGPVGIATLTGQAARIGFSFLTQFVAMISINLTILNILPFPALDGGRAVMIIIEKIKGSPINKRTESLVNTVGFAFLITLMIYVTIKDVVKFF